MNQANGADVWEWPEFQAFAERLGIDLKDSTSLLTITVLRQGPVRIAQDTKGSCHDFLGQDRHLPQATSDYGMWSDSHWREEDLEPADEP